MSETHVSTLIGAIFAPIAYWIGLFVGRIRQGEAIQPRKAGIANEHHRR